MSRISKYYAFILILVCSSVLFQPIENQAQGNIPCEVSPLPGYFFSDSPYHLLTRSGSYEEGYVLHSTSENFVEIAYEQSYALLSPQGDWLLFRDDDFESNVINLRLLNLEDDVDYEMAYETELNVYDVTRIDWFGAPEILITRVTVHPRFLPIAVANIPEQTIDYVFSRWVEIILDDELSTRESDPLLPDTHYRESYIISPNGQYLLWREGYPEYPGGATIVYDATTHQEILAVSDYWLFNPVWSQDSDKIIFMNSKDDIDQYHILDIPSNTVERISDLVVDDDTYLSIEDNSWSPDNRYLAVKMTPSLMQPGVLHILDTTNRESYSSCFTDATEFRAFDFAWSQDSRFLAFEGIFDEQQSIYIYDVEANKTYDTEYGDRYVIGWAISSDVP